MEQIPEETRQQLRAGLERVRERMERALERAGRPARGARLVAVTKSVPPSLAATLVDLGQRDLGENRPEQIPAKDAALGPLASRTRWHMIGRYQRRKIRDTLPYLALVHSVHSLDLLERLHRRAAQLGRHLDVLLQVNVSGEGSKQGFMPAELPRALESAGRLESLSLQGLMTMAPLGLPSSALRALFGRLRELRDRLATPDRPLAELSMGMSGDFEEALLEGATLIRVGSALFEDLDPGPPAFKGPRA